MNEKWKMFEKECVDFLNKTYGNTCQFKHCGGSDSTVPDILVKTNTGKSFYIEIKMPLAQCGQFVLLPNNETRNFIYSKTNKTPLNDFSEEIINYMNKNFDMFSTSGTKGEEIQFDNSEIVFRNWILKHYEELNVKLIITKHHSNFIILPINKLSDYFTINGIYRIKKSGSKSVGKKNCNKVLEYIQANYDLHCSRIYNDKLYVTLAENKQNKKFFIDKNEFMFSLKNDTNRYEFEVRKLSNTNNANVIFSIRLKLNIHDEFKPEQYFK